RASGDVRLYDLASGREEKRLAVGSGWRSFAPHPDGRRLAVAPPSAAQVWDVQTGEGREPLGPLGDLVTGSRGGEVLAGVSTDNRIRVLDLRKGRLQSESARMPWKTGAPVFNPAGDLMASTGWDQTLRLWDPTSCGLLLSKGGMAHQCHFSPDGRLLG